MWPRFPLVIVIASAAIVVAALYVTYRLVDPLPPRRFAIAAGATGSGYDNFARQYARILARQGVELEVRNSAGAVENLDLLRTGTPSLLRNLRNSVASAFPLAGREPRYDRLSCRF
jgi:TRAP-type uncharacterized transport system substrate-binding protein